MDIPASSYFVGLDLARVAAAGFACLGLATGVTGMLRPRDSATTFGLPQALSAPANPWITVVAGRNVSNALALLVLCRYGARRAVGICIMSGVVTGVTDAVVCWRHGKRDVGIAHGVTAALFTGLGSYMVLTA